MSQVVITTTATTQPMVAVCSGASLITVMVTPTPTCLGQVILDQQDVVLLPLLALRGSSGLRHVATATTTSVPDAFSDICQLCCVFSSGELPFQS